MQVKYADFAEMFQPERIIDNPSDEKLREWALEQRRVITEFGNLAVTTQVRNRIAKFTEVVMGELGDEDRELVHKVLEYVRDKEMTQLGKDIVNAIKP